VILILQDGRAGGFEPAHGGVVSANRASPLD
jgi:hypothetical protein